MPRKRLIDPDFWLNGEVSKISDKSKLLFIGLWNFADDQGIIENNPIKIRAQVFPYNPQLKIEKYLQELLDIKKIISYKVEDKEYFFIKNFHKYQTLGHPVNKFPTTPEISRLIENSRGKRREEKRRELEEKRSELPSFKKLKPYFKGNEMRKSQGCWWVIESGEWLEFAGLEKEIEWK